jgi:hypothetical protein
MHANALVMLVIIAWSGTAAADECIPLGSADLQIGTFYVDAALCQPICTGDLVIYEESNGMQGLQRHDDHEDWTCGGMIPHDRQVLLVLL